MKKNLKELNTVVGNKLSSYMKDLCEQRQKKTVKTQSENKIKKIFQTRSNDKKVQTYIHRHL